VRSVSGGVRAASMPAVRSCSEDVMTKFLSAQGQTRDGVYAGR
jgi:hypothetical protein